MEKMDLCQRWKIDSQFYVAKILPTESSDLVIYVGIFRMLTPISKTTVIIEKG